MGYIGILEVPGARMPEVSGASEHSVDNDKLSFVRIYYYLSLLADNKYEYKLITY